MNTVGRQPMDGWNTLSWKKIERVVLKLQKRIDRAQCMMKRRLKTVEGMRNKHQTIEEPCAGKLASTVLKQRRGERFPRLL
jgi:hypothetical protein